MMNPEVLLDLQKGDRLPTVAALQILLNKHNIECKITGTYSDETVMAVKQFQNRKQKKQPGVVVTGQAGPATWIELTWDTTLRVIDAVDVTDPSMCGTVKGLRDYGAEPVVTKSQTNSIPDVISRIQDQASGGEILLLRFHGHGAEGEINISGGQERMERFDRASLTSENVDELSAILSRLTFMFAPYGSVELHACSVAGLKDFNGDMLLTKLAKIWGVPVTASLIEEEGWFAEPGLRFSGEVRTVCPENRTLESWAAYVASKDFRGF
jgi:hypothetical protein